MLARDCSQRGKGMELVTEYLVIIERQASEAFFHLCDDINEFNKLLQSDPNVAIENRRIRYRSELECTYEVKTGTVSGKDQRFFQVRLAFDGPEEDIEGYTGLLRAIKGVIHRAGGQPETLWDDVSLYYSQEAYPLIHRIENMMRRLITYFMLTNVGKEWVTVTAPSGVREAIDRSKRKEYLDVLHQIDFKHLADFLFKAYQTGSTTDLYEELNSADRLESLDLDKLRKYVPRSNWERYFSDVVSCDDRYLHTRWNQLYELRCMVAHNALVTKGDYDRIVALVHEVETYLQEAIDNLDRVHVPSEDREQVAEIVASNISALYGEFIELWKAFEAALARAKGEHRPARRSPVILLQALYDDGLVDEQFHAEGRDLVFLRNRLVHDASVSFSEQEIRSYIVRLDNLIGALRRTWKDEIVDALEALGGEAVLADIYGYIENHRLSDLPETWKATVRYNLALYSSETETYKGGEDLFCHLGKGHWGLKRSEQEAS
jgi:hypothetical protein